MVAALEREVRPLIRNWRAVEHEYGGKRFWFYESDGDAVLVCAGIGEQAARRASEAIIAIYAPRLLQSVGFAGALESRLAVGDLFIPARVIDGRDGSSASLEGGTGVLLSFGSVADSMQKAKLAQAYGVQAIDMEAAAVGKSAESHSLGFCVVKVISDEHDFELPVTDRFVTDDGQFQIGRFLVFVALRPWLWPKVFGLARRTSKAAGVLCQELKRQLSTESKPSAELDAGLRV